MKVVLHPANTAGEEALRVEVKYRWPDAELMWLPRTVAVQGRRVTVRVSQAIPVEFNGDYAGEVHELTVAVLAGAVVLCSR